MNLYSFYTAKKGSTEQEYEDASDYLYIKPKSEGKKNLVRFAVSDGATESSFSKIWAKILVRDYNKKGYKSAGGLEKRINTLSKKWSREIKIDSLPWYAKDKAKNGAFSTLLGLELEGICLYRKQKILERTARSGKWSSISIGDSCLFQIRDNDLIKSFPIDKASDFTSTPLLLSSNVENNSSLSSSIFSLQGSWKKDDEFFIGTDAFSAWFLSEKEKNRSPWVEFYDIINDSDPNEKFKSWVNVKRECGELKNDDTTVIFMRL